MLRLDKNEKAPVAQAVEQPPPHYDTVGSAASDKAIPVGKGDIGGLLVERLRAWKHAVGYLEAYVSSTERVHKEFAKEYEKVLKTVSEPLREGNHFDQGVGGMASFFENIRTNTQAISHSHLEAEKALKGAVLPILENLHHEIKERAKTVHAVTEKSAKAVLKARNHTQNYIELLGQHSSSFDSIAHSSGGTFIHISGTHSHNISGKPKPENDPYVLRRGIIYRLHKQALEENANRQELLSIQNQMKLFEAHILQTVQQAMAEFYKHVGTQADKQKVLYGDIVGAAQRLLLDFEWNGFAERYIDVLISPSAPAQTLDQIKFPNMDHMSSKALIEGTLQRKGKIIRSYSTAYYVVTPSKYLHEFKDNNNFKEPEPETSIYLPDCTIGALSKAPDAKFVISGKESGGALKGFTKHDFAFKAASHAEAAKWHEVISQCAGLTTNETPITSPTFPSDTSQEVVRISLPTYSRTSSQETGIIEGLTIQETGIIEDLPVQETGITEDQPVASEADYVAAAVPIAPVTTKS